MELSLIYPLIAGVIRSVSGWLENSIKDGKIDKYEWALLGKQIIESLMLSVSAMIGLGMDAIQASGFSILASYGISALKKRIK